MRIPTGVVEYTSTVKIPALVRFSCPDCRRLNEVRTEITVTGQHTGTIFSNRDKAYARARQNLQQAYAASLKQIQEGNYRSLALKHCRCAQCGKRPLWYRFNMGAEEAGLGALLSLIMMGFCAGAAAVSQESLAICITGILLAVCCACSTAFFVWVLFRKPGARLQPWQKPQVYVQSKNQSADA